MHDPGIRIKAEKAPLFGEPFPCEIVYTRRNAVVSS
jgi:hypothetical protein